VVLWDDGQARRVFDALGTDDTEVIRSIAAQQRARR
jgi:hypothetical protein